MPNGFARPFAGLREDCIFGFRQLRRHPGFSLSAILALALGISFSTTTFSFADALLYRPLDIPELDRFVQVSGQDPALERNYRLIAPADFVALRDSARTLGQVSAAATLTQNLTGASEPVQALGYAVSADFFPSLGVAPMLGRVFLPEEFTAGKHRTVILTHALWRKQFGEDPGVLNRTIEIDGQTHHIAGVMPDRFRFPRAAEYWTPLAPGSSEWAVSSSFYLSCFARLAPGQTLAQARAEIAAIAGRLAATYPDTHRGIGARVDLVRERVAGDLTAIYTRLSAGAVVFLLLIACANVANLQLARVLGRVREVAIRGALGASTFRILRQILIESVLLASAGALLGLPLAAWLLDLMKAAMPPETERWLPAGWLSMGLNREVLLATAATALLAGIVAGIGPAWWLARRGISLGLAESARTSASAGRQRLRAALVVSETALAAVLLAGAALMVKGFRNLSEVPLRCNPDQVLVLNIALPESRYGSPEALRNFHRAVLAEAASTPALASAALLSDLPYSDSRSTRLFLIEGEPAPIGPGNAAQFQAASAGAFRTLGIPILEGRAFSDSDTAEAPQVAVVSRQFVRRHLHGGPALGRRIRLAGGQWAAITGVVEDVRHDSIERSPRPVIYRPYEQEPPRSAWFAVAAGQAPAQFSAAVRAAVRRVDPVQPVARLDSYRRVVRGHVIGFGYIASLLATLGLVALFLSVLGVYSLMAYTVGERTREIGIRMALGATAREVLLLIFRRGSRLAALGLAIGLAGAWIAARMLAQVLYGVNASDPLVFLAVASALAAALALACLIPAQSAASTNPITALHEE